MIGVEHPGPVAIILAAGFSRRMGFDKLARELGPTRGTLLAWAIRNCAGLTTIVVASRTLAESASVSDASVVVVNDEPARGMTHSLRLGVAHVARSCPFAVMLADTPLVGVSDIMRLDAARIGDGADVAFPQRGGVPGHPVVFGPSARDLLDGLPEGDSLRTLRGHPLLRTLAVAWSDDRPFVDIDDGAQFDRFSNQL